MSTRRDRGKPAFLPNPNNLGGCQQILDEMRNFKRRVNSIQPSTVEIAFTKKYTSGEPPLSERLRVNRAARRACVDQTPADHVNRIYHMHRRIEDMYGVTERRKDPWDTSVYPVYLRRPTNTYLNMIQGEMESWGRPHSVPPRRKSTGDGYVGWSIKQSMMDAFPTSRYVTARRLADHATYKKAIMAEIVDNRMYKEADLRRLFRAYVRLAPMGDKETVEAVVAEIKHELDVP